MSEEAIPASGGESLAQAGGNAVPPAPAAAPVPAAAPQTPEGGAKPQAPASYNLKTPEGWSNTEVMDMLKEHARSSGMTNAQAQQALEEYVQFEKHTLDRHAEQQAQARETQRQDWVNQIRKDPELGGANFQRTLDRASRLLKMVDPKGDFRNLINSMPEAVWITSHPVFVRTFEAFGRVLEDDSVDTPGGASYGRSLAQKFYPGMNP